MLVWLSISTWVITGISILYLLVLFYVAYWGQKSQNRKWIHNPYIYSLSLGVSCTSWAFYGIVGQASQTGQWLSPIYIGTIAFFIVAWPVLVKLLRISKQQNLTSIADFLASRYENTPKIAATVSVIALIGTIPYMSLQLRAISQSFDLTTGTYQSGTATTLAVTTVLIAFSILFGARDNKVNKQNPGLIAAIAFSSLIKLFIFIIAGLYITFSLFDGFDHLTSLPSSQAVINNSQTIYLTFSQILLGGLTIFLTPQMYHMFVIENNSEQHLKKARWLYPLYLILINIFVLPIALAGQATFPGGSVNSDTYILTLPLFHQEALISGLVYIGGLAASISMIIVAAIVLSSMLTTELIAPTLLKWQQKNNTELDTSTLLNYRRGGIAVILISGFIFERLVNQQSHLSNLGILAFVLLAQLAPAVIGALYWRKATSMAAMIGLVFGTLVWAYTLLLPMIFPNIAIVEHGLFNIAWLKPTALFGLTELDIVSHGVFSSLLTNAILFIFISSNSHRTVGEKLQAEQFLKANASQADYDLTVADVTKLLKRFLDTQTAESALKRFNLYKGNQRAPKQYIEYAQRTLASVLGTTSTRLVMQAATSSPDNDALALERVAGIVDEASQLFEFNRELLQAGLENIEQGISVIDADMRLVAWNKQYISLLDYPANFLQAGMHISELIRFNIDRGIIKGDNVDETINKRIMHMQAGHPHYVQRSMPSGLVIEIRGQAMPGGGFVSTFSDITKHIEAERALQKANETLENRVLARTAELQTAKAEAEAANKSKTRFLAAASHDLMQPFNAMSLFTEMLHKQLRGSDTEQLAAQIQSSLSSVEAILTDLVTISKLDGNGQELTLETFALDDILRPLSAEFSALAEKQNIKFRYVPSSVWVHTDKRLLRRLIQNLLSNAINYSPLTHKAQARVTLGIKRSNGLVKIVVVDNGPGIPKEQQTQIFAEFERLALTKDKAGLGLGLAIVERISRLLKLPVDIRSEINNGALFSVAISRVKTPNSAQVQNQDETTDKTETLNKLPVLIVDNEPLLLDALKQQLLNWQCDVTAINGHEQYLQLTKQKQQSFELIIADYHLDNNEDGITLSQLALSNLSKSCPVIICSADPSDNLRQKCHDAQFYFMKKPIKSLALKRQIKQLL